MEVSRFGAPETPSPPAQAHPHSGARFREPKRLRSFGKNMKFAVFTNAKETCLKRIGVCEIGRCMFWKHEVVRGDGCCSYVGTHSASLGLV